MTIRKTFKWFTLLLFLGGMVAGAYGYKLWSESDELLRQQVIAKLKKTAPGWNFKIGKTRYVWPRRLYLYNVRLTAEKESGAMLNIPQIIISVDRRALSEHQEILIEKIQVIGAHADLILNPDGKWNWQSLPPLPPSNKSCPEWFIEHASITVNLKKGNDQPPAKINLKNIDGHLLPSGKRKFLVSVASRLKDAGKLSVEGKWDLSSKKWNMEGHLYDISSSGDLLNLLASVSPKVQQKLDQVKQEYGLKNHPEQELNNLGITGRVEIGFKVQKDEQLSYSCQAKLEDGKISNPLLPFPLHDVSGSFNWENQKIEIKKFEAKNGMTQFKIQGFIDKSIKDLPGQFQLDIGNLPMDYRLRNCLKGRHLKLYSSFDPTGYIDVKSGLTWDGKEKWSPVGLLMNIKECTFAHETFPYRIQQVVGGVVQEGNRLDLNFKGRAGQSPVNIKGKIHNPGPTAQCDFKVVSKNIRIDDRFREACKPAARKVIESLQLTGHADILANFYRPPGLNKKIETIMSSHVYHAAMNDVHFPYQINQLSGMVDFNSRSDLWTFKNLEGTHGTAKIFGEGSYSRKRTKGAPLTLRVEANSAKLDRDLYQALPLNLQQIWQTLDPRGLLEIVSIMEWGPGQPFDLVIKNAEVTKGALRLISFPYPINNLNVEFYYDRTQKKKSRFSRHDKKIVTVTSFSGNHNQTKISGNNVEINESDNSIWNVYFPNIRVKDLVAHDPVFRKSLPPGLQSVVNEMNPIGILSLKGKLDLKGSALVPDEVTAAWDIKTFFTGNTIQLGVEVKNMYGQAHAEGTYGKIKKGRKIVDLKGRFSLNSIEVWGYQLNQVEGPFTLIDQYITVGSENILRSKSSQNPSPNTNIKERVTAKAIGGKITLDAQAILPPEGASPSQQDTNYHVLMTLERGKMEEYASRYMNGQNNLRGTMKGWIDLHGRGSSPNKVKGKGQLLVKPAALLELPAIAQMMQRMSAPVPRNSAFQAAFTDFDVENAQFNFKRINLIGDTITFIGKGTAGFNGNLNLDFYSQLPKTRTGVPLLDNIAGPVVGQLFKGWIGVRLKGNVNAPQTVVIPVPIVEESMKQFIGVFDGRPRSIPNMTIPPLAPTRSSQRPSNQGLRYGTSPPR